MVFNEVRIVFYFTHFSVFKVQIINSKCLTLLLKKFYEWNKKGKLETDKRKKKKKGEQKERK